jgi:hypothetical protein
MRDSKINTYHVNCNNCGKNDFRILFQGTFNDEDSNL